MLHGEPVQTPEGQRRPHKEAEEAVLHSRMVAEAETAVLHSGIVAEAETAVLHSRMVAEAETAVSHVSRPILICSSAWGSSSRARACHGSGTSSYRCSR